MSVSAYNWSTIKNRRTWNDFKEQNQNRCAREQTNAAGATFVSSSNNISSYQISASPSQSCDHSQTDSIGNRRLRVYFFSTKTWENRTEPATNLQELDWTSQIGGWQTQKSKYGRNAAYEIASIWFISIWTILCYFPGLSFSQYGSDKRERVSIVFAEYTLVKYALTARTTPPHIRLIGKPKY